MNNDAPDIYLMKREKSRAGCLRSLFLAAAIIAVAAGVWAFQRFRAAPAEPPVEFPAADVDAPLPDSPLPDLPSEPSAPPADTPSAPPAPPAQPAESPNPIPPPPSPDDGGQPSAGLPQPPAQPAPPPPPPPPPPSGNAAELLASAQSLLSQGSYDQARETALQALDAAPADPAVEKFLSDLAMPLLASKRPMAAKVEYTVASGDFLSKIAGKFNTPVDLIARANDIKNDRINIGQRLLLLDGKNHPFTLQVSKSANSLVVLLDGRFFKRYRVATGRDNSTPVGTFKIVEKTVHPTWFPSGRPPIPYGTPENQLGTHWLALDLPGYGLHGTWQPETLGSQASDGCVRLANEDIEELYTILPRGTLVTISD